MNQNGFENEMKKTTAEEQAQERKEEAAALSGATEEASEKRQESSDENKEASPAKEAPAPPPSFYGTPPYAGGIPPYSSYQSPLPPKKSGKGWKYFAVIVAVCAILGLGVLGGYLLRSGILTAPFPSPSITEEAPLTDDVGATVPNPIPENQDPVFLPDESQTEEMNAKEIYANNVNSIVGITVEGEVYNIFGSISPYASSGTGFILREDGYILTNYHVVEGDELDNPKITVTLYNTETYEAKIIGYDEYNDVALIKIEAKGLDPISLGDSNKLVAGENVAIIGHPLGELTYSISKGIVAAVNRKISVENTTLEMFQIDAAVNSGNSGGPAFNERGQVVGIVTSKYASSSIEGLGFCIPINNAVKIANDLINYGFVRGQAGFGITVRTVYSGGGYYQQPFGLLVQSVNKGSCSEKAGIVKGDIIVAVDGKSVTSTDQLASIRSIYRAGDTATLTLYRDEKNVDVEITFDEYIPEALNQAPSIA